MPRPVRIANCSGFYGDRFAAAREMLAGPDRRADRRLPGRADHAHPVEGPPARIRRWATRPRSCGRWRTCSAPAWSAASRSSPTPAASTRPAWPPGLARAGRELGLRRGSPTSTGDDLGRRLRRPPGRRPRPRPPRHRRAAGRRRTSPWSPPTPTWAAGASPPRCRRGADVVVCPRVTDASAWSSGPAAWWHGWAAGRLGPPGRGGRRRPRHRVRPAGHRRQLPPSWRRSPTAAIPASRSPRSPPTAVGVITKHPGTGGLVSRRHRHRPAAVRDRPARLRSTPT